MTKIREFYILLLLLTSLVNAQVVIKDSISNDSVPYVEFFSKQSELIGVTDSRGEVSINLLNKINNLKSQEVIVSHPFYKSKQIDINQLKSKPTVLLSPIYNKLNEVIISTKQKKYLKVKAYYRILCNTNENLHNYVDGIVDYYIDVHKNKIKTQVLSNRIFKNNNLKVYESGLISNLDFSKVAYLNGSYMTFDKISNKYNINKVKSDKFQLVDKSDLKEKGYLSISNDNNKVITQFKLIQDDAPIVNKIFGYEFINISNDVYMINQSVNIEDIRHKNLLYFKTTSLGKTKRKKESVYKQSSVVEEIFILNTEYTNEIEKIEDIKIDNYWQNIQNPYYQPLPESIEKYIKENLTEVK
jgi:hypothetical protein